jgi:hypothetical protein
MMTPVEFNSAKGVVPMLIAQTPEAGAVLSESRRPVSLAMFQFATLVPAVLAIIGVEGIEGPKPENTMFYGIGYAFWGLCASLVALVCGIVALVRCCRRRRESANARSAFNWVLGTWMALGAAVLGGYLQLISLA